jgi:hypothetical protein
MSPKLARDLRFADTKSGQTYQCAVWKGWATWSESGGVAFALMIWDIGIYEDFTLCEMDEVHLILGDTFVETHMVDVRHKSMRLWCVMMAKNWIWHWQKFLW